MSKANEGIEAQIPAWFEGVLQPMGKLEVHKRGLRHKAVSVFVLFGDEILLQRRALEKYHTPGLWANTCCTHPMWSEGDLDCAKRRLSEELGLSGVDLRHKGQISYKADVGNGLIENEQVEVFCGRVLSKPELTPNPDEVMDVKWLSVADIRAQIAADPDAFTPWLRIYLAEHSEQILAS